MTANEPEALLVLPHLRIQNANAISSPLTWGFPAATAFTGFVHALQRRLASEFDVVLEGVGIVCHHFEAQLSQPAGKRTRVFNLTRNPVGQNGSTAAIVEEGRAHLDVSLVIGMRGAALYSGDDPQSIAQRAWEHLGGMRMAGGSVLPATAILSKRYRPDVLFWQGTLDERRALTRKLAMRLLPGFALVSREALLQQHLETLRKLDPDATSLDALLDLSRLNIEPPPVELEGNELQAPISNDPSPAIGAKPNSEKSKREWLVRRKPGWLVPIPVGYAAISPLYDPGKVKNVRDRQVPFRFVESVFSLGQWLSPHRIEDIRQLLWYHQTDLDAGVYRTSTPFFASITSA